jgi:hypothetical protein
MNMVGAVFADFVDAPGGGRSQLTTELAGQPILVRTLRRLLQVLGLNRRCLVVRPRDREAAAGVLAAFELGEQVELLPVDTSQHSRRLLLTAARKWNLTSWRGGLMGATWFDEFVDPLATALVLNHYKCAAALVLDGHQAVFDPVMAAAMLSHHELHQQEAEMTFTQAPPGLAGIILRAPVVQNLLDLNVPLGLLLSYRPELAQSDLIIHEACYHVVAEVAQTAARFVADTRRSREVLDEALRELGDDACAAALCTWVAQPGRDAAGPLPVETELELTTADPLPNTTVRLRGDRVPRRELRDIGLVTRVAEQLVEYDDRLVFLAGHGDPLQHPQFAEVCRRLRAAGVYGLGVATPLVDLSDENLDALFANRVDVVEVEIDAHSRATYQRLHGVDRFEQVQRNVERIETARRERNQPQPIVVPSLTRCAATIEDLDPFYDHWIREVGSALIGGYNDWCGELAADPLLPAVSPLREPCWRLRSRMMLLADGTAALCSQDFRGAAAVGTWITEPLRAIWSGARLEAARAAQRALRLEAFPLCRSCSEWGRR